MGGSTAFHCTLPRLICEKGMITGNAQGIHQMQEDTYSSPAGSENIDDDTKLAKAVDKEDVCQASKMHYDSIIKDLNMHNLRSARSSSVSTDAEAEFTVTDTQGQEQASDGKSVDKGALALETPFTLSKMSRLNHSQKPKLRQRLLKHSEHNATTAGNQIRSSSFISHDEDGSIMDHKSLSHLTQQVVSLVSNVYQIDLPKEHVVHPSQVLSHFEQVESPVNDGSVQMSPIWYCGSDCEEFKSFPDPDKVVLTIATADVMCSISLFYAPKYTTYILACFSLHSTDLV